MQVTVNVECTPDEARAFLGLPDVSVLNELMVSRVAAQAEANMDLLDPSELMKSWMSFGGLMRDQFMSAMTAAAGGASDSSSAGKATRK